MLENEPEVQGDVVSKLRSLIEREGDARMKNACLRFKEPFLKIVASGSIKAILEYSGVGEITAKRLLKLGAKAHDEVFLSVAVGAALPPTDSSQRLADIERRLSVLEGPVSEISESAINEAAGEIIGAMDPRAGLLDPIRRALRRGIDMGRRSGAGER